MISRKRLLLFDLQMGNIHPLHATEKKFIDSDVFDSRFFIRGNLTPINIKMVFLCLELKNPTSFKIRRLWGATVGKKQRKYLRARWGRLQSYNLQFRLRTGSFAARERGSITATVLFNTYWCLLFCIFIKSYIQKVASRPISIS